MSTSRLTPSDWIRAGLQALASDGPAALRAETLARKLGTTKGSFYWHFKDVAEYHQSLLDTWSSDGATGLMDALAHIPDPAQRLRALGQAAWVTAPEHRGGARLEPAIRALSLWHAPAAAAVQHVDRIRLEYISDLLAERGITNSEFARVIYAAYLGLDDLSARGDGDPADNARALATLIDLVLILDE